MPVTLRSGIHIGRWAFAAALLSLAEMGCHTAPPPEPRAEWLTNAQQQIAAREYQATANDRGLQAPNRANGFRTYFTRTGIAVHDRVGGDGLVGLTLSGLGRGAALDPVSEGELWSVGARVEIRRPGVIEWYVNSPAGLEQGFTIAARPRGDGELVLELGLSSATASWSDDELFLATNAGRRLSYGQLMVVDARGRRLPARVTLASGSAVQLGVDDRGADYPITIDPLLTGTPDAQLTADQLGAAMGASVAGAGDVNGDGYDDVIVGAPYYDAGHNDEGAAFVFLGSASGLADGNPATAAAQLESDQASDPARLGRFTRFGWSVAGAGDTNGDGYADVIVGAPGYDVAGDIAFPAGAAFLFLGSASGIADGNPATASALLESDQKRSLFGFSVAGAGDVNGDGFADVIVGAPYYDDPDVDEGAASVYLPEPGIAAPLVLAAALLAALSRRRSTFVNRI